MEVYVSFFHAGSNPTYDWRYTTAAISAIMRMFSFSSSCSGFVFDRLCPVEDLSLPTMGVWELRGSILDRTAPLDGCQLPNLGLSKSRLVLKLCRWGVEASTLEGRLPLTAVSWEAFRIVSSGKTSPLGVDTCGERWGPSGWLKLRGIGGMWSEIISRRVCVTVTEHFITTWSNRKV